MKTGLVMEGGAMRGMFTMGVIDIMMEHGITYDGGIGVSAGAAFGCNYKSGQIGRVIRYNKAYCRDKRFSSIRSWVKTGNLFGVDFCYHELPEKLDPFDNDAYVANPMDFYVVCTDVMTGKPVYHRCDTGIGENVDWMRASASIPLFAEIVEIDGVMYYVDHERKILCDKMANIIVELEEDEKDIQDKKAITLLLKERAINALAGDNCDEDYDDCDDEDYDDEDYEDEDDYDIK